MRAAQTDFRYDVLRRFGTVARSALSAAETYFTSNLLIFAAGLLSMPVMTRLLSKEDYGLLSLVFATVSLLAVLGGLGFGEAAVRLFSEQRAQGDAAVRRLCDTLFGGALAMGVLMGVVLHSFGDVIAGGWSETDRDCLLLASLLVVVRVVSAILYQIYRAEERAAAHAATRVGVRYVTGAVAITLLLVYARAASVVIFASLLVEAVAVGVRLLDLHRRGVISRPRFAPALLVTAARYGVPLAIAGGARFLLDYGDRFIIEHLLGLSAVATYSVAYDAAQRVTGALLDPLQLAIIPVAFRLWAAEGREATAQFASRVLTYMVAVGIPVALLYWMLNDELIAVLASAKYDTSSALTPYLLPGVLIGSMNFMAIVGLTIHKRTGILAVNVWAASAINIALNLLLVPRFGLAGAGVATSVAYAALWIANYRLSRSVLPLRLDTAVVGKSLVASAAMLLLVSSAGRTDGPVLLDVALRGTLGGGVVVCCFLLLDVDLRRWAWLRARQTALGRGL